MWQHKILVWQINLFKFVLYLNIFLKQYETGVYMYSSYSETLIRILYVQSIKQ